MKQKIKKSLSIFLVLLTLVSMLPYSSLSAVAEENEVPLGYIGIYNKDDLDNIKLDLSGKYILMKDIKFTDEDFVKGGSFYNSGLGWEPIGSSTLPFKGTFNGNGHYIYGLNINNSSQNYCGLFGKAEGAYFSDVYLDNVNINGGQYVGALVGNTLKSSIYNCVSNGKVVGKSYVGGIAGNVQVASGEAIGNCLNVSNVSGETYVGGICGNFITKDTSNSTKTGYVIKCVNEGAVVGSSIVGGILGGMKGYVYRAYTYGYSGETDTHYLSECKYCYNRGNVKAITGISGGIVGSLTTEPKTENNTHFSPTQGSYGSYRSTSADSTINECYSVGLVEGINYGAICGNYSGGKQTKCYYLDDSVNEPTNTEGIVKSNDQLIKQTCYQSWDFTNVWKIVKEDDYPYPIILNFPVFGDPVYDEICKHEATVTINEKDASCEENGYTGDIVCVDCGESVEIGKVTDKTGHNPANTVNENEVKSSCTSGGSYESVVYCETCGKELSRTTVNVEPNGHTLSSWIVDNNPSCLKTGLKHKECIICEKVIETAVIAISPHQYNIITNAPTCTEEGFDTYTCAVCKNSYNDNFVPALGHNYIDMITQASCTEKGYITHFCQTCDEIEEEVYSDSLGHKDNNGDGICDACSVDMTANCSCNCHKTGFMGFIWKIVNFFNKIFKTNSVCGCGKKHY